MGGAIFVRTLQLQHDLTGAVTFDPFVGDGRPGDIAAEVCQFFTLIGAPADRRIQAKPCPLNAALAPPAWLGSARFASSVLFLLIGGSLYSFNLTYAQFGHSLGRQILRSTLEPKSE
jgi:hypothetical protein